MSNSLSPNLQSLLIPPEEGGPAPRQVNSRMNVRVEPVHVQALLDHFRRDFLQAAAACGIGVGTLQAALNSGRCTERVDSLCDHALRRLQRPDPGPAQVAPSTPVMGDDDKLAMVTVPPGKLEKFRQAMAFLGLQYLE